MAHYAAVRAAVFMGGNFLGWIWMDLYRFPLLDSTNLVVHIESRN